MYATVPSFLIFDDDEMTTKPTKSILIKELKMCFKPEDYNYDKPKNAVFVIDIIVNPLSLGHTGMHTRRNSGHTRYTDIYIKSKNSIRIINQRWGVSVHMRATPGSRLGTVG